MQRVPFIHILILTAFLANTFWPLPSWAQARLALPSGGDYRLPAPGVMVHLSPQFNPPVLKPNEDTKEITINEEANHPMNNVGLRKFNIKPV